MDHTVELLHTAFVTHDTKQFVTTRPPELDYEPGQGVELALDVDGWRDEGRPFTPTSLGDERVLEFVIKRYPDHDGVTRRLHELESGATLHMSDSFGSIAWQGPGIFLAAGAGITPFLAILRERARVGDLGDSVLHFSNSTPADIICERELEDLLEENCRFTCTRESGTGYDDRRIDETYLEDEIKDLSGVFYICGPMDFVEATRQTLLDLGAEDDRIVVDG